MLRGAKWGRRNLGKGGGKRICKERERERDDMCNAGKRHPGKG